MLIGEYEHSIDTKGRLIMPSKLKEDIGEKFVVTKGLDDELDKNMMLEEIQKLSPRDKEIIELRYGLNGKTEMTQKDVANLLGISQSYISRIEKKVIKKLKTIIKN